MAQCLAASVILSWAAAGTQAAAGESIGKWKVFPQRDMAFQGDMEQILGADATDIKKLEAIAVEKGYTAFTVGSFPFAAMKCFDHALDEHDLGPCKGTDNCTIHVRVGQTNNIACAANAGDPAPGPAPVPPATTPAPVPPTTTTKHTYPQPGPFLKGMHSTHFWDCEAGVCDSSVLQPFEKRKAVQSPANAPADPNEHGGPIYGEKLWMTGAPSDAMSRYMGPNLFGMNDYYDGKCGGCGQCLLVKNPNSRHPDWTVVVMKKVRCHPANPKCSGEQRTVDFAVPSFDHLQYSLANRCGAQWSDNTFITREQSGTCGALPSPQACDCTKIPDYSPELKMMRRGCELFKEWGWNEGAPTAMEYVKVECPQRMVDRFRGPGGINAHGVVAFFDAAGSNLTAITAPALPAGSFLTQRMILPVATMCSILATMGLMLLALRRGRDEVFIESHLLAHLEPEPQLHLDDDLSS